MFIHACRTGTKQGDDLQLINIGVNILVITVLLPLGRRAWAYYEAKKDEQLKRLESTTDDGGLSQELQDEPGGRLMSVPTQSA